MPALTRQQRAIMQHENQVDATEGTDHLMHQPLNAEVAYFDSLEWMTHAVQAHDRSVGSELDSININALIVGRVCSGYALEFAYKALLYAQGKRPIKEVASHHLVDLHKEVTDLCDETLPDEERDEHITFVPPERIISPPRRRNPDKEAQS